MKGSKRTDPLGRASGDARLALARPLRVVFLSCWLPYPHGMAATNRVRLLARGLVEAGADAHVLVMQASDRPPHVENHETKGVHMGVGFEYTAGTTSRHPSFAMRRLIELRGWLAGAWRLCELRRKGQVDCVYLWFTVQRWQARRAVYVGLLRALRVPIVIELNERPWSLRPDRKPIERLRSPFAGVAGAVPISGFLTQWARREAQHEGRTLGLVEVPILVDVNEQEVAEYPGGQPTVVFAGSPVYNETIAFILEAMRTVWRRHPECRLAVTGVNQSDPAARWITESAAQGVLDDRVLIAGYLPREQLLSLYARSHALLVPLFDDVRSHARFPTKLGEYLGSGRPVIATAVGEMERYLKDGETAFLCPPGDPEAYGDAICRALEDREAARRIGGAGRQLAERCFDFRLHGQRLLDMLTAVSRPELRTGVVSEASAGVD